MKKMLSFLFLAALLVSVYVDLTRGTLPAAAPAAAVKPSETPVPQIPHFSATVNPGETLLSIVEQTGGKNPNVPISKLISDFESLNPGVSPERLQIGKTYSFPSYSN